MQEWKDNLKNYLINNNMNKFYDLIMSHAPQKLYKFFNMSKNSLNNLTTSTLYLSEPSNFNDPYDSKHLFDPDKLLELLASNQNLRTYLVNKYGKINLLDKKSLDSNKKLIYGIQLELIKYLNDFCITCFTENDFTNILMWSHYAESHKGFCLEYNTSESFLGKYKAFFYPVIYSDKIFDLSNCINNLYSKIYLPKKKRGNNTELILSLLYKADVWKYEKEWRLILIQNNEICINKPSAIYLGLNTDKKYKSEIIHFAKNKHIPIYQMKQKGNEYKLIPELIEIKEYV